MSEYETPDEARKAMGAKMTEKLNEGIGSGLITGLEPIPMQERGVPGAEPPVPVPAASAPTPVPVDPPTDPAVEVQDPSVGTPPPETDPNPQEPEPPIFGKFKDLKIAEESYYGTINTLSDTLDENTRLKQQLAMVQGTPPYGQPATIPGPSPGARDRVNPIAQNIDWGADAGVVKVAQEVGVEPAQLAPLMESMEARMAATVEANVEASLAPARMEREASVYMQQHYPESLKHQAEMAVFVKTNPNVGSNMQSMVVGGNVAGALEYAWQMYSVAKGIDTQSAMQANSEVAEEERLTARAAAGLPASPNTPVHAAMQENQAPTAEYLAELNARASAGDDAAIRERRRNTFGSILPQHWFTGQPA